MASAAELRAKYVASQAKPSISTPSSSYYSAPSTPSVSKPATTSSLGSSVGVPTYTGGGSTAATQPKASTTTYNFTQTPAQNAVNGNNLGTSGYGVARDTTPIVPIPIIPPRQTLDEYMALQKSSYDTDSYLKKAKDLATLNANLKYDPVADDLKTRVAKLVSGYKNNLTKLPTKYNPMQAQVNTDQQNMLDQQKANMARRGLTGSGVDNGAQMQALALSADNRTDIIGQQNQEGMDINRQIDDTTAEQEIALNGILRDKQNYSVQQVQEAQIKLDELKQVEKMTQQSNYYKEQGLTQEAQKIDAMIADTKAKNALATRGLDINENQFVTKLDYEKSQDQIKQSNWMKEIGLEETKMTKEDVRYWAGIAKENYQFESLRQDKNNQFEREMGLKQGELAEMVRQFDEKSLADKQALAAELSYKYTALDVQKSEGAKDRASRASLAKQEMQSFTTALQQDGGAYAGIPDNMMKFFLDINEEVDNKVLAMTEQIELGKMTPDQAMNATTSLLKGGATGLSSGFVEQKLNNLANVFGVKRPDNMPNIAAPYSKTPVETKAPYTMPPANQNFMNNTTMSPSKIVDGKFVPAKPMNIDSPLSYFKNSSFR